MKLRHKLQKTEYKNAESERGKTKKGYVLRNFLLVHQSLMKTANK